ncbi:PDZ domain-containing protein [Virgibacillus ihumii]|uniref:PDZ domain-containing protein n=1 Tax=Virgibacillus ihumii TaxID=2686091 RepID=UPI00157E105A|nr:PDZ domain-containing protein [Virgibacillus ihumii]
MAESWLIELAKGVGKIFFNPLLYWIILLIFLAGIKRIQKERNNFGFKLFDVFSEWKNTWTVGLLSGLFISIIFLGAGVVFSYETILVLSSLAIILSITLRFTLLSASYTVGIGYLILLVLPFIPSSQNVIDGGLFTETNFTGLVFLLSIMLFTEAVLTKRVQNNTSFPDMISGRRGMLVGAHHIKKLSVIPFFVLVPSGLITSFAPFWPYFSMNGETYSLLLVPFLVGFDYTVKSSLPEKAAERISKSVFILGSMVFLLAVGSIYVRWLSIAAIVLGIIGKEFISYRHRAFENKHNAYFSRQTRGFKVLGIVPNSPAERLGVVVGDSIVKVNGHHVNSLHDFYYALQKNTFFKLEIVDEHHEVRFVQSPLYEGDHHELGIVTTTFRNYETEQKVNQ